jgi:hypothetical protein
MCVAIVFATAPGYVALDGADENSPFTTALVYWHFFPCRVTRTSVCGGEPSVARKLTCRATLTQFCRGGAFAAGAAKSAFGGPRTFDEITPSEWRAVGQHVSEIHQLDYGSDEHLRATLQHFGLRRLTTHVGVTLLEILNGHGDQHPT